MSEKMKSQAAMTTVAKEPSNGQIPVDPNNPPSDEVVLVQATQYLVDEIARCCALAHDASVCDTGYSRTFLVNELAKRLETYQARGLPALVNLVNKVAAKGADGAPKAD